jgi:hypothetical protein
MMIAYIWSSEGRATATRKHPALRHGGGTDHELTNWELYKEDGVVEIDVPQ